MAEAESTSSTQANHQQRPLRIGILGFGALGQYLATRIIHEGEIISPGDRPLILSFVWARDPSKGLSTSDLLPPSTARLSDIDAAASLSVDLVVEVCHPEVVKNSAVRFLENGSDILIGSPTALADANLEAQLRSLAPLGGVRRVLIPAGALWASSDIARLGAAKRIASLSIEMRKHPLSLSGISGEPAQRLAEWLKATSSDTNTTNSSSTCTLYDGPVRALAIVAPNNVNTMAAAAISVPNLGFDGVRGILIADSSLTCHIITTELEGFKDASGECLSVKTIRKAPAPPGAVTSTATLASFWASLRIAANGIDHSTGGIILC